MDVMTQVPLDNPQQVSQWLQTSLPGYEFIVRGRFVVVGSGVATGVLIRPEGPGRAKLIWAFPSLAVQLILTLAIVFTGILPGLILFGIVWLAVKGGVDNIRQDVARVLAGGAGAPAGYGMQPMPGAQSSGGGARAVGVVFIVLSMMAGAYTAYAYSNYSSYRYATYSSSYGRYGGYGSYGGYESNFAYYRRRHWEEQMQIGGGATGLLFLLGIVLVAAGGKRSAPQPMGFPQAGAGYPMQNTGYPMQAGGYGPPQGAFQQPPQGAYGAPQGGYGAPQGGYGAPQGGYGAPPPGGMASQPGGFAPQPGGFAPPPGGMTPPPGGFAPPPGGMASQPGGLGPQGGAPQFGQQGGQVAQGPSAPPTANVWPGSNQGNQS